MIIIYLIISTIIWRPYLTWKACPCSSIVINWKTDVPESSIVEYGLDTLFISTVKDTIVDTIHHLELSGLLPDTVYFYRIKGDRFYRFRTAPANWCRPFNFIVYGDSRSNPSIHQQVINAINKFSPWFIVHTGDFVYHGDALAEWNTQYFDVVDTLSPYVPIIPVPGNHENPYHLYHQIFELPAPERWYALRYNNAYFIVVDADTDVAWSEEQTFLSAQIDSANNDESIDWIFVSIHKPPYSGGGHGSDLLVRSNWCPLFKNKVDIVFSGHNHFYQRTEKIDGVTYIVTGGGGAPLYTPIDSPWVAHSEQTYHFCRIEIDRTLLRMWAIDTAGNVFDSLILIKPIDVKICKVVSPSDTIEVDSIYGVLVKAFVGHALIESINYYSCVDTLKDSIPVITYFSGDTVLLEFDSLRTTRFGVCTLKFVINYPFDTINVNDTFYHIVRIKPDYDADLLEAIVPQDTVMVDSFYTPEIKFYYAGLLESLKIHCVIDTGDYEVYHDSTPTITDDTISFVYFASFSPWRVPVAHKEYRIKFFSTCLLDTNQTNDTLTYSIFEVNDEPIVINYNPGLVCTLSLNTIDTFTVEVCDYDGDSIIYRWFVDTLEDSNFTTEKFIFEANEPTEKSIKVKISDGFSEDSLIWTVYVESLATRILEVLSPIDTVMVDTLYFPSIRFYSDENINEIKFTCVIETSFYSNGQIIYFDTLPDLQPLQANEYIAWFDPWSTPVSHCDYLVKFIVYSPHDATHEDDTVTMVLHEVNDPPEIINYQPVELCTLFVDSIQIFTVHVVDYDGDELTYQWFINSIPDTGTQDSFYILKPDTIGIYKIAVKVTDGYATDSLLWQVIVSSIEEIYEPIYFRVLNPLSTGEVVFEFNLPEGDELMLHIYDIAGRKVASVFLGYMEEGKHTVEWERYEYLLPGVYFCELKGKTIHFIAKFVIVY